MPQSDDDNVTDIRKYATNIVGRKIHAPMSEYEISELLDEQGDNWRLVWESIPTHPIFDQIYAKSALYNAFIYEGMLFERRRLVDDQAESYVWEAPHTDILHWLLDHPPFDACAAISDLYTYSEGIDDGKQPIVLFALITGLAECGDDVSALFGVGLEDATYLGRALEAWGEYADVVNPYTHLLFEFAAAERDREDI